MTREEAIDAFKVAADNVRPFLDEKIANTVRLFALIVEIAVLLRKDD